MRQADEDWLVVGTGEVSLLKHFSPGAFEVLGVEGWCVGTSNCCSGRSRCRSASQLRMYSPRALWETSESAVSCASKVSLASQPSVPRKEPSSCTDQLSRMVAASATVAWCGRCPETPTKRCPLHNNIQEIPHGNSFVWLCVTVELCAMAVPRHSVSRRGGCHTVQSGFCRGP